MNGCWVAFPIVKVDEKVNDSLREINSYIYSQDKNNGLNFESNWNDSALQAVVYISMTYLILLQFPSK